MKRYLLAGIIAALFVAPAKADWTGLNAIGATITFKNPNACTSVACVPIAQPVDSTGASFGVTANPFFIGFGTGVTLPAFASTPTVNLGTIGGVATQTTLASILAALGSPFQAGGSIGNTSFAATQATASALNATVVGTGTFAVQATQSGTWNINNISGTVSLPTGAATAAKQPALGTAGSASTDVLTMQGIASMTPLLATLSGTNNINNISGTISLPTGAATAALQTTGNTTLSGINTTLGSPFQAGGSIGNTTFAVTQATAANLNMTCANCSGSGASGTDEGGFTAGSSIFAPGGGFFQTTATSNPLTNGQWGAWQMTANRAGFVNLRNASGTEIGTSSTPVQVSVANTGANATAMLVTGTGGTFPASQSGVWSATVTQATAANLNATVVGTGTFPVQATLQASATTAIGKVDPNTIGSWGLVASTQNGTTPTNMALMAGQFNTTPTTITSGNVSPFQMDNAGNLLVNIKAGASSGAVAQGSTTSGQTGGLTQAAATTSAPSYTTGTTNPLSTDLSGNLRVSVASATGLAQGSTTSGQTGSLIMGAVTTSPPSYTTAQTSPISLDTAGNIRINCVTGCGGAGSISNASSAVATSSTNVGSVSYNYGFNGTTWDQLQVDGSKNLKVSVNAALPAGTNLIGKSGIDQTTPGTTNGVQDAATSATGSAPASKAIYTGANGSGNLTGEIVCDSFITYDASTNGSTQLVALSSGKSIYVCGYTLTTGATATNVKLIYGTGTACVTSPQPVTPAYQLGANSGIVDHASNHWSGMKTAASNELCINASAGNPVQATVYYTQF